MANATDITAQLPVGGADMSALRRAVNQNSPEALKAVAQQFEALLVNMMIKSMREATPKDSLFNNEQTRLYTTMLDQRLSQDFAKRGIGLADALVRQLSTNKGAILPMDTTAGKVSSLDMKQAVADTLQRQQAALLSGLTTDRASESASSSSLMSTLKGINDGSNTAVADSYRKSLQELIAKKQDLLSSAQPAKRVSSGVSIGSSVQAFVETLGPEAKAVSSESGIPSQFMLGQAALETGWGKHVMTCADGTSSHNLFGIKATKGWKGKVVESITTEYVDGVAYRKKEKFRAYDSYEDSFRDYANLLQTSPRYQQALVSGQDAKRFAQAIQRAGYATDPNYAAKLTKVIQKTMSV